jgi:D(-)-tartrate dehydratase
MRIRAIRERTVPIGSSMRNASIAFDSMTASAIVIETEGESGYAFDSIGRYGKGGLLRERFIPRLLGADPQALLDASGLIDPAACVRTAMTNEKPGGHGERPGAIGLLEAGAWDLRAKMQRLPLWRSIAQYYGIPDAVPNVSVYASCGHFRPGDDLREEMRAVSDAGYRIAKIKVGGADLDQDLERVERAGDAGMQIAVDVNGMLSPQIAEHWFAALGSFGLLWIEEPSPPLDFEFLKSCSQLSSAPLATGENLFALDDARNLLRYGGLRPERDFVQFDPLLSYGVGEYVRILALFQGWDRKHFLPHAGHLFAVQCVAGLKLGMAEAAPDPALPHGGFWDGTRVRDGSITVPDLPGVGYEGKQNLYAILESI